MKQRICWLLTVLLTMAPLAGCGGSGATALTGQYVRTTSERDVFIQMREDTEKPAFIFMEARSDMEGSFDGLETGDTIEIRVVLINYDDTPNHTEVFSCKRRTQGVESDIPSEYLETIAELDLLSETSA